MTPFQLPPENAQDRKPLDLTVPINDDFDYSLLEKEIMSEAECAALNIAAIFEAKTSQQKQLLVEITGRIAERYQTRTVFKSLSCTDERQVPDCKKHSLVISIDKGRCGAFLAETEPHTCSLVYCVG